MEMEIEIGIEIEIEIESKEQMMEIKDRMDIMDVMGLNLLMRRSFRKGIISLGFVELVKWLI